MMEGSEEIFDQWLDEVYGDVDVCGMDYPMSKVLKEVDPIAYDVMYADWSTDQDGFY